MKNKLLLYCISSITEIVITLSKVFPLVLPLHENVRQVGLGDFRPPDADGITRGLNLLTALLQGPQLLPKVTGSVLEKLRPITP